MIYDNIHNATSISWSDAKFLDQFVNLLKEHPEFNNGHLIGRTGAKLFLEPKYKGRAGALTDLDFLFESIPDELSQFMYKENLIERARTVMDGDLRTPIRKITYGPQIVYKFRNTILPEVDVFEKNIGSTSLPGSIPYVQLQFSKNEPVFNVAHPGILTAAILHPSDLSWRLPRGAYLVESFWNRERYGVTLDEMAKQCTLTLKESGVDRSSFETTLSAVKNKIGKKSPQYQEFVNEIYKQL